MGNVDKPKTYVGQGRKAPHDEFVPGRERPGEEPNDEREAEDALDSDRPSGAQTTPIASRQKSRQSDSIPVGIRWMRS